MNAENYIEKQAPENQKIIKKLRELILRFGLRERLMKEGLWYDKFYIACFKDHTNLGVNIRGLDEKEASLFLGKGKAMRHLKFYKHGDINEKELFKKLKIVYEKSICDCNINWKT